jgi:amino acid transporter
MDAARARLDAVESAEMPGERLKRGIGPGMLLLFVVGDILGAGIYARVGGVADQVGGAIWVSFVVAMVIAALSALSYVELVTKYPGAGGAALFVNRAFRMPFFTFMVGFAVLASGISSAAAVSRAFGGRYLQEFIAVPAVPVALLFLIVVALINFRGISESVKVNMGLTLIELSGLLLIVLIGIIVLASGSGDPGRAFTFKEGASVPLAILGGAVVAFYAFLGFEDAVNVAEECQQPSRIMPLGLLGGLGIATLVYLAVSFTASMVVPPSTLAGSTGPLLEVVKAGPIPVPLLLFSAIALMAIANTALINMIMASRILYGMAGEGIIPRVLGRTSPTRQTPWVAIIFTTLIALVLAATGDLGPLADTTVMLLLVVFAIVNVAVLVLRKDRVEHEHFTVPTVVPILGAISSVALLTQQNVDIFIRAGALLAVGLVLWVVNLYLAPRLDRAEAGASAPLR